MKANEFLDRFSKFNADSSRTYDEKKAQALRNLKIIPKGSRGPHAPHLEDFHMARLLIALAISEMNVDIVNKYRAMKAIEKKYAGADNFEGALSTIFKSKNPGAQIDAVIICRSWPEGIIIAKSGEQFIYNAPDIPKYENQVCRVDFKIGWLFFDNIVCRMVTESMPERLKGKMGWEHAMQLEKIRKEQGEEAAQKWAEKN